MYFLDMEDSIKPDNRYIEAVRLLPVSFLTRSEERLVSHQMFLPCGRVTHHYSHTDLSALSADDVLDFPR